MNTINKCLYCKNSFETWECWVKRGKSKYCSRSCASSSNWESKGLILFKVGMVSTRKGKLFLEVLGSNNGNWKGGKPKCIDCDKIINYNYTRCKRCSLNTQKREGNPNWRGGATSINESIRKSKEYEIWRKEVLERDNYTCQICGTRGGYLEVDHIKRFSDYPEIRTEISNGRTLCRSCHKNTETYGRSNRK